MDPTEFTRMREELGTAAFAERLRADPVIRAAFAAHVKQLAQRDVAEAATPVGLPSHLWRVSEAGRGFDITNVPIGVKFYARAVSDLLVVKRHWWNGGDAVCLSPQLRRPEMCPHCGSSDRRERKRDGYFDAILRRQNRGESELFRAVVSVPAYGVDRLANTRRWIDDSTIAIVGVKLELFRKAKRSSPVLVEVTEETCPFELPPAIDVREPLMRRWHLDRWPDDTLKGVEPEDILKFRRQA